MMKQLKFSFLSTDSLSLPPAAMSTVLTIYLLLNIGLAFLMLISPLVGVLGAIGLLDTSLACYSLDTGSRPFSSRVFPKPINPPQSPSRILQSRRGRDEKDSLNTHIRQCQQAISPRAHATVAKRYPARTDKLLRRRQQ